MVDEDLAVDGLELVGAWPEHLCDDVRSPPLRWGEACGGPCILGQAKEGDIARFI